MTRPSAPLTANTPLPARASEEFLETVAEPVVEALDLEPDTIYALDAELRVCFVNPGWAAFAAGNEGLAFLARPIVGLPLEAAVGPDLWPFYAPLLRAALESGVGFTHDYPCDSPTTTRVFRMRVNVVDAPAGRFLVVHNDPIRIGPAAAAPVEVRAEDFTEADGMMRMCAHCRRSRRRDQKWVWVPEYLNAPPAVVSHTLCASCLELHYPE